MRSMELRPGQRLGEIRTLRGPCDKGGVGSRVPVGRAGLGHERVIRAQTPGRPDPSAHLRALSLRAGPTQHLGDLEERSWGQTSPARSPYSLLRAPASPWPA